MKGKKLIAILCSVALIVSLIPATAFAVSEGDGSWMRAYNYVEEGDVVWKGKPIAHVSNVDEVTIVLESVIYKDASHQELYEDYGDIAQSITSKMEDEGKDLFAPTNVVIDEVKVKKNKEAVIISYICTEIQCGSSTKQMKNATISKGNSVRINADTALDIQVNYYEDKGHKVPYEPEPSRQIALQPDGEGAFVVPATMVLDKLKYNDTNPDSPVLEYLFRVKRYELKDYNTDPYYDRYKNDYRINLAKTMDQDFVVGSKVYEDKALTKLIDDDNDGFTKRFVVDSTESTRFELLAIDQKYYRLAEIQDLTHDEENPRLIYVFYDAFEDVSEENKNEFYKLCNDIEENMQSYEGKECTIQIADPDDTDIPGWNKWTALDFASSDKGLQLYLGFDEYNTVDNFSIGHDSSNFYYDENMTDPVGEDEMMMDGTPYYLQMSYHGYGEIEGVPMNYRYEMKTPCKVTFEFVDVEGHEKEIQQIKDNLTKKFDKTLAVYNDLAWVNTLVANGARQTMPSPAKNASSMIKQRCPEVYQELVGDTKLDLSVTYGFSGDAGLHHSSVNGEINFFVDDLLYYAGYKNCGLKVEQDGMLYVPEGTEDYATHLEERVNAYLGSSGCSAEVEKLSPEGLLDMLAIDKIAGLYGYTSEDPKAAYMTKKGIVFYSHPEKTTEEYFLGYTSPWVSTYFETRSIEEEGSIDYFYNEHDDEGVLTNVGTFPAYKISLADEFGENVKSYICLITTGTEEQMEAPYAEWTDRETDIITQGMNGQIPLDAYTKIRVIKGGDEIKVIQSKVGSDKEVHAFNINALTNFKDGRLEDLGGGRMKVMIPMGILNRDSVKAHYVDADGNVYNLDFTIETRDGKEYVCFITNHFSVYALSGDTGTTSEPVPTPCNHQWVDATCTTPKTCSVCGTTEGSALGHKWTAATCTTPKTCSVCGTTEGGALEHKWTAATCTTPKTCSVCGTTEGGALGHKWTAATCTTPKTCNVCGTMEGSALDHKWTAATCTTPKTCNVCGTTEGSALDHKAGTAKVIRQATTSKDGRIETKCIRCSRVLKTATIKKASKVTLSTASYTYNGKIKSPKIYVKDSANKTISSKYYTVFKPNGRKSIGKYTYTVKFKGNYSGSKKLTLTIKPVKPTMQTPKPAKKAITVKWKKGKKTQVTGYQVMVATNSKFTKNKKTATVKGYSKVSKKMTSLKAKSKYYVKVRAYKIVNGEKIYSDWSKVKTIRTK